MRIFSFYYLLFSLSILHSQTPEKQPRIDFRYNQLAYSNSQDKIISIASLSSFHSLSYKVVDDHGNVILEGESASSRLWKPSNEHMVSINVNAIQEEGNYKLTVDNKTLEFQIKNKPFKVLAPATLRYYYYNRASTGIPDSIEPVYKRNNGIRDDQVHLHNSIENNSHPNGYTFDGSKGWYDAGDYNKYIVNSGISTYTLLAAYSQFPEYYKKLNLNLPESNNTVPDLLDEIKYNLDWMLTMQDPKDGGVYHKLTGLQFSGIVMPEDYDLPRYAVKKSTAATLDFAAVMAKASQVYQNVEGISPGYATKMLKAARQAYAWAVGHPDDLYKNPQDVATGEYGDDTVKDEFFWAAVELYLATKEPEYLERIELSKINPEVPNWADVGMLGILSLNENNDLLENAMANEAKSILLSIADELTETINSSPMRVTMSENDFNWGSNGNTGNQLFLLISAYERTENPGYLKAAFTGIDYLLGRNGTGYSYITGFGNKSPMHPHHRISEADHIKNPIPGMVVGGPNPGQQDGCTYPSVYPAASYSDSFCSYASNEVTINWNAPAAFVMNALNYYNEKMNP